MSTQEPALDANAPPASRRGESGIERSILRLTAWLAEHTIIRNVAAVVALTLTLTPGIALLVNPDLTDRIEGLGYTSVFLMNLASTATFYFPVPGLTAAAQALISTEGDSARFPWLVGVLGGLGMARRRRRTVLGRRAWIPLAAALALLGMLGTAGQRVDLWAHLFGFVWGVVLGIFISFAAPHRHKPSLQWVSGGAAIALVIYCWILALG
jgi:membrane associated rhomboid family serine protease